MIFRSRDPVEASPDAEELAAQVFARRRLGPWSDADESALQLRNEQDADFADAYWRVEQSWTAVGQHASSAELLGLREQAISRARRANARRWMKNPTGRSRAGRIAAAIAAVAVALAVGYQFAPFGWKPGEYRTYVGEQRSIELADHTHVALDSDTRLRVRYSRDSRAVQLLQGQAQFSVAKDSARPFKVDAGSHTVVAVGTIFNVEYVDSEMHVAMLEGKVAVLSPTAQGETITTQGASAPRSQHEAKRDVEAYQHPERSGGEGIYLSAGEELRVRQDGKATFTANADLQAASAWREGKVIFHAERLDQAVRRLNRYSRLQLQVDDPRLASMNISGVFDAGDTAAFVEAVRFYLPAEADHTDPETIHLRMK